MATITFDVYLPVAEAKHLRAVFLEATRNMPGVVDTRCSVNMIPNPPLPGNTKEILKKTMIADHPGTDCETCSVYRYIISTPDYRGSINQLAMRLSRVLTPAVNLPADRVLLENEAEFEVAARYPWMVQVAL